MRPVWSLPLVLLLLTQTFVPNELLAQQATTPQRGFDGMNSGRDASEDCKAPKPPKDVHTFAYVRNGYVEINRILAFETAINAQDCTCPFETPDWDLVLESTERFITSDNPKLPFDVIALRARADALEAQHREECKK